MFSLPLAEEIIQTSVIKKLLAIQEMSADPEFMREVLGLYLEHTPPLVDALALAIDQRKHAEVMRLAHRIKGSSSSIGAGRMAALCLALEQAELKAGSSQDTGNTIALLRTTLEETCAQLRALL